MYAKLFTTMYQGTLRGNSHALLVFTNLLAHADQYGVADIHPRAIAEEVGLTQEQVRAALDVLEDADVESRSPEHEGRRIVRVDGHRAWGWKVVNYLKYRAIRNEDDRREQNRLAQEKWRGKHNPTAVSHGKPQEAHTNSNANSNAELESVAGATQPPLPACPTQELIAKYHSALPTLPRVKVLDDKRKAALRERWQWVLTTEDEGGERRATSAADAVEWFVKFFRMASKNDFVMGRVGRVPPHEKWRANIDYLMTDRGLREVLEKTETAP